ncbi:MAG TPA: crossover junction endodeoxyribonuclease RuvC [Parcubacteria group bacterium]|nr:crossover junction endodeoxyribonuclease RuvC [Parcubacteria group bacterium]
MKIISIDPGYERLGLAIIEKEKNQREVLLFSECFKTSAKLPHHERLALIGDRIKEVIKKWKPEQLVTEKLFFAGNQKTALLVAEARGVILYTGSSLGLEIFEYRPNEIKIAITGYGSAQKKQMMDMTRKLIKIDSKTNSDDELDAIAIGLTHFAIHR